MQEHVASVLNGLGDIRMYVQKLLEMHMFLSKAKQAEYGEISWNRQYAATTSVSVQPM